MTGPVEEVPRGHFTYGATTDLARRVSSELLASRMLQPFGVATTSVCKKISPWDNSQSAVELFIYYQQQSKERQQGENPLPVQVERVQVLPNETVGEIKLRLKKSMQCFTSNSVLIMGDRELAEHEVVTQAISKGQSAAVSQAVVRLKDLESVTVATQEGEVVFKKREDVKQTMIKPRSMLTLALADGETDNDSQGMLKSENSITCTQEGSLNHVESLEEVDCRQLQQEDLKVRGQFCRRTSSSNACVDWQELLDQAVVHLVVHNSDAKLHTSIDGEYFELTVNTGQSVGDFARQVAAQKGLQDVQHKLYLNGEELASCKSLKDFGVSEGSVLELVPVVQDSLRGVPVPQGSPPLTDPAHELFTKFSLAKKGLASGKLPELAASGSGGSYFFHDPQGAKVAVFKPEDEEPMAEHNPRGFTSATSSSDSSSASQGYVPQDGLRRGIRPGEGAVREVIAFLLDRDHFSGVPPTALVNLVAQDQGVKVGSLQGFVEADGDCEERGTSVFPLHEVHKIAVLDIRLGNTDRNAGNILAKKNQDGKWELTPIDHGYCLPDSFEDINFEWMYWRQAEQPFSTETLAYIQNIDIEQDLDLIRSHNLKIRPECERVLRVCTMLLKKAANMKLTPFDIASILCREQFTQSPIEKLDREARRVAETSIRNDHGSNIISYGQTHQQIFEKVYLKQMDSLLDEYLEESFLQKEGGFLL